MFKKKKIFTILQPQDFWTGPSTPVLVLAFTWYWPYVIYSIILYHFPVQVILCKKSKHSGDSHPKWDNTTHWLPWSISIQTAIYFNKASLVSASLHTTWTRTQPTVLIFSCLFEVFSHEWYLTDLTIIRITTHVRKLHQNTNIPQEIRRKKKAHTYLQLQKQTYII